MLSKKALIVTSGLAIGAGILTLGILARHGTLCASRTGIGPEQALYDKPETFRMFVRDVRDRAFVSLIAQFDATTGFFIYSAHPDGRISGRNNDIRQLLGSRVLAEASNKDEALRTMHEQNLNSIFSEWYREDGRGVGFVFVDEKSKLGANAMLLRTLVASPFFDRYQDEAARLAQSILTLEQADGSLLPWYREPDYEYDADYLLTFYSGEAILALLEYAEKTGDQQALKEAVEIQDFYIRQYVENLDANYYPAYVPWHTQSLAKLYERTDEEKYADAIFILNDEVLEMQDRDVYIGRFYNPETPQYGSPHGSSDAVYTEGLAYAYDVARTSGDTIREEEYKNALVRAVHHLAGLQYKPRWRHFDDKKASKRLAGGIKTSACNRWIRVDTTAHTVDALTKLLDE